MPLATQSIHVDKQKEIGNWIHSPIFMEDYFAPGFKTKPAVHIGSQSMRLYHGDKSEQAIEGIHIAAASEGDIVVARNIDPEYIQYWKYLMGDVNFVNIVTSDMKSYLSDILLNSPQLINEIQNKMDSNSSMMVYFPTEIEEKLAHQIGIKLHGSSIVSTKYGTKTGIRELAKEYKIPMPDGYVCKDKRSVELSFEHLFQDYQTLIIKHALSSAGRWMKKVQKSEITNIDAILNEICGGKYVEGRDEFVVEAWIENKSSLCAQIEIHEGQDPIVAAAWQQVIDVDGITYMGAAPLMLSSKALKSFVKEVTKLAWALKESGAVGSYGPDFIITSDQSVGYCEDTALLLELNARVPVTAFSMEIIKQVKGTVGTGFLTQNIKLPNSSNFSEVREVLNREGLLIKEKGSSVGVVPYNVGMLEWNSLYYVAVADTWEQAKQISTKVNNLFK
jgi:hypothetical protein